MTFTWDTGPRVYLVVGALAALAALLLRNDGVAGLFLAGLAAFLVLVAVAMAYGPPKR